MSKVLRTVSMIAGAVALVATGVGAFAAPGLAAGSLGGAAAAGAAGGLAATVGSIATISSLVAGVANIGAQLTGGYKPPPARGSITRIIIDPDAPQPYVMGEGYFAGVLRHDAGYGATLKKVPNPYRFLAVVYSGGGPIESITPYVDQGAVPAWYSGYLYTDTQLGATPEADALSPNFAGAPGWDSTSKLSGYAAIGWSCKFDKDGERFASGLPQLGAYGQWVKVYDPRLDSTRSGGSGSHRVDDETTYEYSDNPALHAGQYAYGRYQNGKRTFGAGLPDEAIDWAAVAAWANVCDTNSWTIFGVIFEPMPDTRWPNLKDICAAGGGIPIFSGGVLSFSWAAPRTSLDTFTGDDLVGDNSSVTGMSSRRGRLNTIVPKYRSADHNWEMVAAADAVTSATYVTEDGEERKAEWPFNLVKDKDQAAMLAAYRLADGRELQPITLTCGIRVRDYGPGDCVTLDIPELGLDTDAVILTRDFDPGALTTTFTLIGETPAKHAWALGQTVDAPETPGLSQTAQERDEAATGGTKPAGWLSTAIRAAQILSPRNTSDVARELLTATDAGATATISVARHDWDYPDGTADQTRELGTITGLSFSTRYYVYFDDESLEDGSPTYAVATDKADALNSTTNPYRHYVGEIVTPANGSSFDTSSSQQADAANDTTVPGAGQQQGWQISLIRGAQISNFRDASNVARASLIATDVGAVAAISVAKHDWDYGGGRPVVTRAEDTISGLSFSTVYHVYFDDTTLADTSPTYGATTDLATAMPSADRPWRHFVGSIGTPANGDDDITTGQASPVTTNGSLLTGLALSQWVRSAKFDNPRNTSDVARKLLTATDAGATATISVARHDWHYPDGRAVVTRELATITGLSFETIYHVYFDDETLADGSVTYYATTDFLDAENTRAHPWRHFLGSVVTPVNGYDDTSSPGSTAEAQANAASGLNAPITWRSDLKIEVHTTWTGAVKDGRLFKYQITRTEGGQDVSADATWMIDAGSHTATVTDGLVSVTAFSPSYESYILVTSIYDGKPEEYLMPVEFIVGPPTPLDGETVVNGDPPCDEGVSGTTYTAFGDVLAAATGANGDTEVRYVCTIFAEAAGHADISLKMQQRTGGGAWGDVASATISAIDFDARFQDGILGGVTYTDTSLSASTVYEYRMLWSQRGTSTATGRIVGKRWAAKSD